MSSRLPEKPTIDGIEQKWVDAWERDGIYHFDRTRDRDGVYSIDTPPPTVSGSLHVGHGLHRSLQADAWLFRLLPDGMG